ncbi:MAG: leucine-rich repeat protein [Prevotella sp.]
MNHHLKFTALVIALLAMFSRAADATVVTQGPLKFSLNDETGSATVSDCLKDATGAAIPDSVGYNGRGYRVTAIGHWCFDGCDKLMWVKIPSSVTSLGNQCFNGCVSMGEIFVDRDNPIYDSRDSCNAIIETETDKIVVGCKGTRIPSSVKTLGRYCFRDCQTPKRLVIPSSVEIIEEGAFYECSSLQSVEIPSSVTEIGSYSFSECVSLRSIEIPSSVTTLGDGCLRRCSMLEAVTVPSSVKTMGKYILMECDSLTTVVIKADVESLGYMSFKGCISLQTVSLSPSVRILGSYCFAGCTALQSIAFASSIREIGDFCFDGCLSLREISIPSSVEKISGASFQNCTRLTSVSIPESVTSLGEQCFSGCISLQNVKLPISLTVLEARCFKGCTSLVSIDIPSSVTALGDACFEDCTSLLPITIPSSVKTLGNYCFERCTSLSSIDIPSSVTKIDSWCFRGCTSLRAIYIPASVEYIGNGCFASCPSMDTITVDKGNRYYDSRENCNGIIYTPSNSMVAGCKRTKIPTTVYGIGANCFNGCTSLLTVDIPSSVTGLYGGCFEGCTSLKKIEIPSSVTHMRAGCFYGCTSVETIEIPSSVKILEEKSFGGCTSLKSVACRMSPPELNDIFADTPVEQATLYVMSDDIELYKAARYWSDFGTILPIEPLSINVDTETKEAEIKSINYEDETVISIPETVEIDGETYKVTSIASEAFKENGTIESVALPRSLREIGRAAFAGCKSLTEVSISKEEKRCKVASATCSKIRRASYSAEPGGMRIGEEAFEGCLALRSVTIPGTTTEIGDNVFDGCKSLTDVTCEAFRCPAVREFGNFPISSATLTVPAGVEETYRTTSPWSLFGYLKTYEIPTGVSTVTSDRISGRDGVYSPDGTKKKSMGRGMNIIRMSDGTRRKVMVR